MAAVYTENRDNCHGIPLFTKFRDRQFDINPLLLKDLFSGTTNAMSKPDGDGLQPPDTEKDSAMHRSRELMNPAVIATLLLFAGSVSTAPAMADDRGPLDASEISFAQIEEASKEHAALANEAAVEEAAQAIKAATRLDLDIRLIGRTSVLIAGDL